MLLCFDLFKNVFSPVGDAASDLLSDKMIIGPLQSVQSFFRLLASIKYPARFAILKNTPLHLRISEKCLLWCSSASGLTVKPDKNSARQLWIRSVGGKIEVYKCFQCTTSRAMSQTKIGCSLEILLYPFESAMEVPA